MLYSAPVTEDRPVRRTGKSPLWARLLTAGGVALTLLSLVTVVAVKVVLDAATSGVHQVQIDTTGNAAVVPQGKALQGDLNVLLAGLDNGQAVGGELRTDPAHTDSMMILHVTADHSHAYLISLPRDLWVDIPGHGGGKLNAAYTFGSMNGRGSAGGLDLLMKTINALWGIKFNAAATVDFTGFTQVLQVLGGVTMDIDEKVTSVHYGTDGRGNPCVPARFNAAMVASPVPGCQGNVYLPQKDRRLTPVQALDYTRQREWLALGDGDYGRQRHQQQFVKALVQEAKTQGVATNPAKALALVKSAGSALGVWTNGAALVDWIFTLKDLASSNIVMIKTNGGTYHSQILNGQSTETLDDTSKQMLTALRDGRIADFVSTHPALTTPSA